MLMEFWLGLYGMQSPRTYPRSFPYLYRAVMDHAMEAERLGFDGFALTEHHFWYDGYCPSLLPVLAGIAQRTKTIRLLPCALLLPLKDPLRVAEEIAVVDHLSHGRLTLALGYGYRSEEFEGFGLDKEGRGSRFSEMIEILRLAFAEETFSFACRRGASCDGATGRAAGYFILCSGGLATLRTGEGIDWRVSECGGRGQRNAGSDCRSHRCGDRRDP
jgi:alkanesulfonate monooxygenase SsuD/methylene tetrahydromethanopterin reductase-like flavin-dependent oxidoreductase (luciferase family)